MTLLLDTHTFVWWLAGDKRITPRLRHVIEQNSGETFVSAISAYEMSQKNRLGKWPEIEPVLKSFESLAAVANISLLDITPRHAIFAGQIAGRHRDPFDRILAAQARLEGMIFISTDKEIEALGVKAVWE